jgi:chaperonin cofactor prefoldin
MTRYEQAIERVNQLLGEDNLEEADVKETDPMIKSLQNQKETIQKQIETLDKQRKPLMLRLQDINKQLTLKGQEVSV